MNLLLRTTIQRRQQSRSAPLLEGAFTLVEMLLVVAIISLLIALLLPALNRARNNAFTAVCLANLKEHGHAFGDYHLDSNWFFPSTRSWADLSGKAGSSELYGSNLYDFDNRPLNPYLGSAEVSRCPSDRGDSYDAPSFDAITNCYEQYGNSYQAPFSYDVLRTEFVMGRVDAAGNSAVRPKRLTHFRKSMSNKLIQSDWVWWGNRPLSNPKSWWHNDGTQRKYNTLFADFHAELFTFPLDQDDYWPSFEPPDPANSWY